MGVNISAQANTSETSISHANSNNFLSNSSLKCSVSIPNQVLSQNSSELSIVGSPGQLHIPSTVVNLTSLRVFSSIWSTSSSSIFPNGHNVTLMEGSGEYIGLLIFVVDSLSTTFT